MTTRRLLLPLLAALLLAGGCTGGGAELPAATDILARSAEAMRAVRTVALDLQVDPAADGLPIRAATGSLTASGEAEGTATLVQGGAPVELGFVVTGGNLYLRGPAGGFGAPIPVQFASSIYDPTALLDPERGVAALLAAAEPGETQARESVDGVDAFRVAATFPEGAVTAVVPGVREAVDAQLWVDAATSRLVRAELAVPAAGGTAPVTVRLSDFDAPVDVTPPA